MTKTTRHLEKGALFRIPREFLLKRLDEHRQAAHDEVARTRLALRIESAKLEEIDALLAAVDGQTSA